MPRREFDAIKVKDQLGKPEDIGLFGPFKLNDVFLLDELPTVFLKRTVETDNVWGKGTWGESLWSSEFVGSAFINFVLDSDTLGLLNYSGLGDSSGEPYIEYIHNRNDEFKWYFQFTFNLDTQPYTYGLTDKDNSTATEFIDGNPQ